jgi:GAF domain-containing protein
VHQEATVPETVERVLDFALAAVDCSQAGVVFVQDKGRLDVVSSTDPGIQKLVATQMETGKGPVLEMVQDGVRSVMVSDTQTETRWPAWASTAAEIGYRSMIGVRLATVDRMIGTLNLYDSRPHHFSDADVEVAHVLARHTAIALNTAYASEHFSRALDSRKLIGQAQGILMERQRITADAAFDVLRRASQHLNVKLRDVAQRMVDTGEGPTSGS